MSLTLRTTADAAASAACRLCPVFRRTLDRQRSAARPQVEIGAAVLGSMIVGAGFWTGLAYWLVETFF